MAELADAAASTPDSHEPCVFRPHPRHKSFRLSTGMRWSRSVVDDLRNVAPQESSVPHHRDTIAEGQSFASIVCRMSRPVWVLRNNSAPC